MPNATIRSIGGIHTTPNPFSAVPEGALVLGDEVVERAAGALEPRRGKKYSTAFNADRCFPFPTTSQMFCTLRGSANPLVYNPDTDTVYNLTRSSGLFQHDYPYHTDPRVSCQAAAANGNIYFTTANGIQVAPGLSTAQWRTAGLPRPVVPVGAVTLVTTGPTPVGLNRQRTYRMTFGWFDELGNFLESPPTEPITAGNTVGPGFFSMRVGIGLGLPANAIARLYRSYDIPINQTPSDDMFLVGQLNIAAALRAFDNFTDPTDSGGSVAISDFSVDTFLARPLYTNAKNGDGLGIAGANYPPPAAGCIAWFKNRMYFGRCTFPQRLEVQIIGTGTSGMVSTDVITLDGITFSTANANLWSIDTVDDAFTNVQRTAQNMAVGISCTFAGNPSYAATPAAANRPITRKLRATYLPVGGSDVGRVLIERIFPGPSADDGGLGFSFATTGAGVIFPNGSANSSDNYIPGSLAWSKYNLPEAVPLINQTVLGDPRAAVLAFSVLRDVMIVWKEDGAWMVRDDGGPQPIITQLDSSARLIAPETAKVVDNAAYGLCDRGPLQVTETATLPVGEAVRQDIIKSLNLSQTQLGAAYAVAYETERLWILSIPASATEPTSSLQWVLRCPESGFPSQLPRLTRWLHQGTLHGMMLPRTTSPNSDRFAFLYNVSAASLGSNLMGQPLSGAYIERKGGVVSTDYADFIGSPVVAFGAGGVGNTLTFSADVHQEVFPGDVFILSIAGGAANKVAQARVLSVNKAVVTLDNSYNFASGSYAIPYYRAIQSHWRHAAITLGEPTAEKQWEAGQVFFDYFDGDWLLYTLDSEKQQRRPFSIAGSDPLVSNLGGTVYTVFSTIPGQERLPGPANPPLPLSQVPWLRNTRDVVIRVDPGQAESRSARLGAEFTFAQALASFKLTAASFAAAEWKVKSTR